MKMVAAAKLRKAQDAIVAARPYATTLEAIMADLMAKTEAGQLSHPLLATRKARKAEILVLTSDRGLAGGFNANINRRVARFIKETEGQYEQVTITTIGRKGNEFLRGRGFSMRKDYPGFLTRVSYANADEVATELSRRFVSGEVDQVFLAYNEFVSAMTQKVTFTQLLPFEANTAKASSASVDYLYEPSRQELLSSLVPKAVATKVFRAVLDSVASEHGARMTAMESATSNASDMIGKLTLFYNRSRQAQITKELVEIVSGAEALK